MLGFKTLFKTTLFRFALIALAVFALSGCGGSDATSTATASYTVTCTIGSGSADPYGSCIKATNYPYPTYVGCSGTSGTSCPSGYANTCYSGANMTTYTNLSFCP